MGRVADPKLASLWRERFEHQRRSWVSVAEYCRREGISTGSFYAWKRRLRTSRAKVTDDPRDALRTIDARRLWRSMTIVS